MKSLLCNLWLNDEGQDVAEYAVMLAVILVIVVGNRQHDCDMRRLRTRDQHERTLSKAPSIGNEHVETHRCSQRVTRLHDL